MQFFRRSFFSKKGEEFKACEKDVFTKVLFCKFSEKRKTRRKRKHRGTFLTFRRTNKQGTEFAFKKKQLQKETCFSKNIAFL